MSIDNAPAVGQAPRANDAGTPTARMRRDAEQLAVREVGHGRAGGDTTALLLDEIADLRGERLLRSHYRRWLVAAGFADGPEAA